MEQEKPLTRQQRRKIVRENKKTIKRMLPFVLKENKQVPTYWDGEPAPCRKCWALIPESDTDVKQWLRAIEVNTEQGPLYLSVNAEQDAWSVVTQNQAPKQMLHLLYPTDARYEGEHEVSKMSFEFKKQLIEINGSEWFDQETEEGKADLVLKKYEKLYGEITKAQEAKTDDTEQPSNLKDTPDGLKYT